MEEVEAFNKTITPKISYKSANENAFESELPYLETQNRFLKTEEPLVTVQTLPRRRETYMGNVNSFTEPAEHNSSLRGKGRLILEHPVTNVLFIVFTLWALFADDLKMLTTTQDADDGFSVSIIILQGFFCIEVIISSLCIDNYFLGFFFWLDIISILSMLLDIHWFYDALIEQTSASSVTGKHQTKRAKVGTKAIRVLRVVRLIRIVRIAKIFKNSEKLSPKKDNNELVKETQMNLKNEEGLTEKLKVGKKLSDLTMRRVIVLVLSMILGIIIFNPSFYFQEITSLEYGIKMFNNFYSLSDPGFEQTFDLYIQSHDNSTAPILYLQVLNRTYGDLNSTDNLRDDEKIEVIDECLNLINSVDADSIDAVDLRCYAVFDNRIESKLTAILNISKTILVCFILFVGSFCFSRDTNTMVLRPLDSMVKKIQRISKNPSTAQKENEIEEYFELLKEIKERNKVKCCNSKVDEDRNLETIILDKTIVKIGTLLAMGYGEAGSKIIEKNLRENNEEINPLSPGQKIIGIYSHFNLKNFTKLIDILGSDYSVLMNEVLQIVNEVTSDFNIYTIKNAGDAMLIIWKINETFMNVDANGLITVKKTDTVVQTVDMALICLIQILFRIRTSKHLDKFRDNVELINKIEHFDISLCMSLNLGWAIEGTTGSCFKIDISYLSPEVTYSRKLEKFARKFELNLVISNSFVEYLSEDARSFMKRIEQADQEIYTIDLDLTSLSTDVDIEIGDEIDKGRRNSDLLHKYESKETKRKQYDEKIKQENCWVNFVNEDLLFSIAAMKSISE